MQITPTLTNGSSPVTVERQELNSIPVPASTKTWQPLSHHTVLEGVEDRLAQKNIQIIGHQYIVSHNGSRFFGTLKVSNADTATGCIPTIGLRNSHDQAFACGLAAGLAVLVCSNLSFSGDVVLKRKHTLNIMTDLPDLVVEAVDRIESIWTRQAEQVAAYRDTSLSELRARSLLIDALDNKVISASRIPEVLQEWREPTHADFRPRTVWSWFNGVTETLKKSNPFSLPAKTKALHEVCDGFVGLN